MGMSVTDDIKAKLDIVNYIQQYVPLKKAGRTYKCCCVFHQERTPSMVVNPTTQTFKCFGCGVGGDVLTFAMKKHGWSFTEALQELGKLAGIEVRERTPVQKARDEAHDQLRGLLQAAADVYHQHLLNTKDEGSLATLKYAQDKRGFTFDTINKYTIGYAPPGWQHMLEYLVQLGYSEEQVIESGMAVRNEAGRMYDRFRNRLMIPIRDERGRVVGFGARALDPDDNPKYLNSPQTPVFDKSHLLFGLDAAKQTIRDTETAVIVEGYMDAIQAHQAGFTNVVAQMGTALTETQLKLVAPRYAKKIILALDSDAAGQNATMRSLEVARQTLQADYTGRLSVDIRILQIPDAKDPDDLIRENPARWQELVDSATPVADYVIDMETAQLSSNATLPERESLAKRVLPILVASTNNLYTQDNLQKLARRLHIAERDLLAWAQEQRKQEAAKQASRPDNPPEPPPLDYETAAPPLAAGEAGRGSTPAQRDTALESYCLRMLLMNPDLWYQVNRKFRELSRENGDLRAGPLADLCADDFSRSDYRALIQVFEEALAQEKLDALDYMRQRLDDLLLQTMETCLTDELDDLRNRVRHRHSADTGVVWKQHEKTVAPTLDLSAELVQRTLNLRSRRLQREREELRFLQADAQAQQEISEVHQYARQIMLSMLAKGLIERELKGQVETLF
jgi:DNA primase